MHKIQRRDFLKLLGLAGLGAALPGLFLDPARSIGGAGRPNILIVVFDAFSALNASLYGYPRDTTPNLQRLADQAIVYHNHYASSNFTTTGTASLLTGTRPLTHRAFRLGDTVAREHRHQSIFAAFPHHHRIAYSHNPFASILLEHFMPDIDRYLPRRALYFSKNDVLNFINPGDDDGLNLAWMRSLQGGRQADYSLFLSRMYEDFVMPLQHAGIQANFGDVFRRFPGGVPAGPWSYEYFTLEDGVDWIHRAFAAIPGPSLWYMHFYPPHDPYTPPADHYRRYEKDGFSPPENPVHAAITGETAPPNEIARKRARYDEFIRYADAEFGRLYGLLSASGYLDDTWLVLTSDHGEMFDRGFIGHIQPVLFEPLLRVPLVIFPPGPAERVDIYERTSAIDLLPTLAHLAGETAPGWAEGSVMPPFEAPKSGRDFFALHASRQHPSRPLRQYTASIIRENLKLVVYEGYEQLVGTRVELYDLSADPEERADLHPARSELAAPLLEAFLNMKAGQSHSQP